MSERRKLIVVSNRGPISYDREAGERVAKRGAGGLVTALAPLVSHHDVTWIASAISDEDRAVAEEGTVDETARDGSSYRLRLVAHRPSAYELYYNVIANPALWFVQHGLWELKHDPERDLAAPGRTATSRSTAPSPRAWSRSSSASPRPPSSSTTTTSISRRRSCGSGSRTRAGALHPHTVGSRRGVVGAAGGDRAPHPRRAARVRRGGLPHPALAARLPRLLPQPRARARRAARDRSSDLDRPAEFESLAQSEAVLDRERRLEAERPELLILRVDRTDPSKNVPRGLQAFASCSSGGPTCRAGSACSRCSTPPARRFPSTSRSSAESRKPRPRSKPASPAP